MRSLQITLFSLAIVLCSAEALKAQSFTYNNVRKDYVFDDGFGINHSKMVPQQGQVRISEEEVYIDGATYRKNEKGVYKNAKGRSVDLSYSYQGSKLVAVRLSTGYIVNNYLVEEAAPEQRVVVKK